MSDPSACFPPWHPYEASTFFGLVQLDCPYGSTTFGEVTVPDGLTFGDFICVIYSLIPIFFGLALVVALCIRRGTTECLLLCFGVIQILLNELIIKRIVAKPRPLGSCNISCGMPSSHATVAAGYCVWLILEVLYANWLMERQRYSDSYPDDEQFGPRADEEACLPHEARTLWGQWCSVRKARLIVALLLICVPVPPCRVALHDHSGAQVIAGIVIGALEGVAWWYVVQTYILPRLPPRGQFWCGCIEDNWPGSRIAEKTELDDSLLAFDAYHNYEPTLGPGSSRGNVATQPMSFGHSSM